MPLTSFLLGPPISAPQELLCPSEGLGLWGECPELCSSLRQVLLWGQSRQGWREGREECFWERETSVYSLFCVTVQGEGSHQGDCGSETGLLDGS